MPDILVKYTNTNAQITCQTKQANSQVGDMFLLADKIVKCYSV